MLGRERLVAHRELQVVRASAIRRGGGDYLAQRLRKLEHARTLLARDRAELERGGLRVIGVRLQGGPFDGERKLANGKPNFPLLWDLALNDLLTLLAEGRVRIAPLSDPPAWMAL